MPSKIYRTAFIYENWVSDQTDFETPDYSAAYSEAIKQMKKNKLIVSVLIYSNKNTAIVIQRKYADKK